MKHAMTLAEERIAAFIVERRVLLFILGVLISAASLYGFSQVKLRNDYRSFFNAGDATLDRTDWLAERMGDGKETAILVYRPKDGDALSSLSILQYRHLQDAAGRLPFVVKTRSWFDSEKVVEVTAEGRPPAQAAIPFAQGADLFTPEGLAVFGKDIDASPHIVGRYIARDHTSSVVVLQIDLESEPGARLAKLERLQSQVRDIERQLQQAAPGDRVYLVGSTLFDYASTEVLRADARRLFPLAVALFAVTLLLLYRSPLFTVLGLVLILLPVVVTAGIAAAAGWEFSTLVMSGLLLVGTLAVADILHVANSYFLVGETVSDRQTALRMALSKNFWAITATSGTTLVGEIALLFSSSPPVRTMGQVVMVGVVAAWLLCVLMLPLCLMLISPSRKTGAGWLVKPLARIAVVSARNPRKALALFVGILAVSSLGLSHTRISDTMSAWFSTDTEFRQGMDIVDTNYLSLRTVTMASKVQDGDADALYAGDAQAPQLRALRDLQTRLDAEGGYWVSPVTAVDALRQRRDEAGPTGFRMTADQFADAPPEVSSRTLSEAGLMTQYQPGRTDYLVSYFDPADKSTYGVLREADAALAIAREVTPERQPQMQGVSLAFAELSASNFEGMVQGSVLVIVIMTVTLGFVFRSFKLCLLSLIPNLAPLFVVYGLWGFIDGRINMAAVSVFSVACGIVIDDTIHFVLAFQRQLRKTGETLSAISESVAESGTGVLATTAVIGFGFFILGQSDFQLTAQKANMVGMAVFIAFVFDLLFLPALLALVHRKRPAATTAA